MTLWWRHLVTEIWWHTIPGDDDFDLWGSSTTVVFYRNWSRFLTPGFYVGDATFGDTILIFGDVTWWQTVPSRVLTDLNWNLSNTSPQAFENSSLLCDTSVTFATYVTFQICDIYSTSDTLVTFVTNCHFSISSYLIKSLNSNSYSKTYRYPHMWPSHQLIYRGWSVTLHHGDHFQTSHSAMSTNQVPGVAMWRHDIWTGPDALLPVSMGSRCCSVTGHNPMRMAHVILPILILYSLRLSYTSYLNPFYLTYAYNHRHTLFIYFPLAQQ